MGSARRWRVLLAALVAPALALAALGAGSYRPFGGETAGERGASSPFVDAVFTLATLALALSVIALVWFRWRVPKRAATKDVGRFSLGAFLLYFALITLAVVVIRHGLQQPPPTPTGEEDLDPAFPTLTVPEQQPPTGRDATRSPQFSWPLAGGAAALLAAAVVVVLVLRRRGGDAGGPSARQREQLRAALDEALDDLRSEPDPRRAVVAAYSRMEQALSVLGLPRDPAEAPYEYLVRVGRELEAGESVERLTELFELAKFSQHGVGEPMREQAIAALTAVRDEVRRGT